MKKMKKFFTVGLLLLFFSSSLAAFASPARNAYLLRLDAYQREYEHFLKAAGLYYQLPTLANQAQAIKAEQTVLLARNEVLLAYFDYLKVNLEAANNAKNVALEMKLKKQIALRKDFLIRQARQLHQATTFDQLNTISQETVKQKNNLQKSAVLIGDYVFISNLDKLFNLWSLTLKKEIALLPAKKKSAYSLALQRLDGEREKKTQLVLQLLQQLSEAENFSDYFTDQERMLKKMVNDYNVYIERYQDLEKEIINLTQL